MAPFDRFINDWQNKKVLIMGLGLQGGGVSIVKFFNLLNCQVTVTDLKDRHTLATSVDQLLDLNIKLTLGKHDENDFKNQDLIIRNPSVPRSSDYLKIAKTNKIPIKMETALFAKYTDATIIGITGTRGKTTTATLIYEILKAANKKVVLAGNIPGKSTLPLLKTLTTDTIVVLELSSWQLQGFKTEKISPHIALVTNIYPDHLNRSTMEEYIDDKVNIARFQTVQDYLFLNKADKRIGKFSDQSKATIKYFQVSDLPKDLKLKVLGKHNLENAAAALAVSQHLDIDKDLSLQTIKTFKGVHSRLQIIAQYQGHTIINDTTSTTPTATIRAIKAVKKPIMLLLGGQSKNLPLKGLAKLINQQVDQIVLLSGSGTDQIKPLLDPKLILKEFKDQHQAVEFALKHAIPHSTILFSPGFTSFDMFNNEFERGQAFNQSIRKLTHV